MSQDELVSSFEQSSEKIKEMKMELEDINITLSETLKKPSHRLPPSPKTIDTCSRLQKKIHELEIRIDDERKYRNQIALELSRLKKQEKN